jgi:hypothetical protein
VILRACESAVLRMLAEPEVAHPIGGVLFADIRRHFGLREQAAVRGAIDAHLRPLADDLRRSPAHARQLLRIEPERVTCAATKSNPCARWPVPGQERCSAHGQRVQQRR